MRAWAVSGHPAASGRLVEIERTVPAPGPGEVLVRVEACGVCRTDLHLAEGDLEPRPAADGARPRGRRHGRSSSAAARARLRARATGSASPGCAAPAGRAAAAAAARENLCPAPTYTGWDADGGYAEYAVVAGGLRLPRSRTRTPTELAAPLLCAGIIGYRALRRAQLPPGGRLGIYGFGASAHLAAQVALAEGATVHVLTRAAPARQLALELGAASAGARTTRRPSRSTRRSCSRRPATSSRWRCAALDRGRDAGASPAST